MDKNSKAIAIVFCGEHYNPLGVIRSLGENGVTPNAIVVKSRTPLASNSKWIGELTLVDNLEEGYRVLLEKYGEEHRKGPLPFLFTSDDKTTSFLDAHFDELNGKFRFFNAGERGRIAHYMNKDEINKCALRHGMNVLRTWVVKKGEIPSDIEYPIITKAIASTVGGWKADVHICHSRDELVDAYSKIQAPDLLLQRYIEKKNEYCLEGFSVNHGKSVMVTIASSYNYILPDAYSAWMTVRNFDNPEVEKNLDAMFDEIGFEGIFETEFLVDKDDKLWFCEINFRNSTWSYASTRAGMPLPILWMKYMESGVIDKKAARRQLPDNFTAMVELNDYLYRVRTGKIGFFKWLGELKDSNCRYFLGKNDLHPFIGMFTSKIKRTLKLA